MSQHAQLPSLDFSQDTDVAPVRPVRQPIRGPGELTAAEKAALVDLLEAQADMLGGERVPVTRRDFDKLMFRVFEGKWTSRKKQCGSIPTRPSRKVEQYVILAGTLSLDQPPPKVPKGEEAQEVPPERRRGAPVYLRMSFRQEKVLWGYVDEAGKTVIKKHVSLRPGATLPELKAELIQRFDKLEMETVREYNLARLIILARRRIVNFSKAGTEHPPVVAQRDRPTLLLRARRAKDLVMAMAESHESDEEIRGEEKEVAAALAETDYFSWESDVSEEP
ncbi:hypothetical protein ACHAPT_000550 [Fusarium lateritium]